jgi:hypothetical protein
MDVHVDVKRGNTTVINLAIDFRTKQKLRLVIGKVYRV